MSATIEDVAKKKPEPSAEQKAAAELVRLAKEQGLSLTGSDGLLKQLTKSVIESALAEELTEHLGYEKHDPAGVGSDNIRNGTRSKTVISGNTGPVEIDGPRDRAGTFEPQIVKKRQRRLGEVDEIVLSLYAKGLTTGRSRRTSPRFTGRRCRRRRSPGLPTRSWRRCSAGRPAPRRGVRGDLHRRHSGSKSP